MVKKLKSHNFEELDSSYKCRIVTYRHTNTNHNQDLPKYLAELQQEVLSLIKDQLEKHKALKVNLNISFVLKNLEGKDDYPIQLNNVEIYSHTDLGDYYKGQIAKFQTRVQEHQGRGSNLNLDKIHYLDVCINSLNHLKGSSYVELEKWIQDKKAVINVKNEDEQCFKWCILAALHPTKSHPERISHYKQYKNELNFDGIKLPPSGSDFKKFEEKNKISVNIITYDTKKKFFPIYHNKQRHEREVDLLFFKKGEKSHYCWIKNLNALLRTQIYACNNTAQICRKCFYYTQSKVMLAKHSENCKEVCRYEIEREDIKFKNEHKILRVPYVLYCDMESLLKPMHEASRNTVKFQKHTACSFGIYAHSVYNNIKEPLTIYRGPNAAEKFLEKVKEYALEIYDYLQKDNTMVITPEEEEQYAAATTCFICHGGFTKGNKKDHDHNHYTGLYRGAACNNCNLKWKKINFIPIVFHNFSKYDSHLFIKHLRGMKTKIIPTNEETYIAMEVILPLPRKKPCKKTLQDAQTADDAHITLRFIDSYRFLPQSLDRLSENLMEHEITKRNLPEAKDYRKGVYPYEYITNFEKFNETQLPPREAFYSQLNNSGISDIEYGRAEQVWEDHCKTMGDYHDYYLKMDVSLLADVFENFRHICYENYELDPAHYYTTPSLSWDSMLKMTKHVEQMPQDINMILLLERGIRGGSVHCAKRHSKADENTFLLYLDANNLYGWALSQPLPTGGFEWVDPKDKDLDSLCNPPEGVGYILEVDLSYSPSLHQHHNCFPLAPERKCPPNSTTPKLLCHLGNREKYVVHYATLKLYRELGLEVTKIHSIIQFQQAAYMCPYIDHNTDLRNEAKQAGNKPLAEFAKLMNNAIFGKSIENVRKYKNITLCTKWEQARKKITRSNFKSATSFTEDLVAIHSYKNKVVFNKPIATGFCVLEHSKRLMYDFHYNVVQPHFKDNVRLLYTDTDSCIYEFRNHSEKDVEEFMLNRPEWFHPSTIGLFKNELPGDIMTEFIGLRAKMYSFKTRNGEVLKRSKGTKRCVLEKSIQFEDYWKCLMGNKPCYRKQSTIGHKNHDLHTQSVTKLALSWNDDKRYLLSDSFETLAHGHYEIPPVPSTSARN